MKNIMENCFGQHGWKEFLRNRKNILDEFDKIFEQTSNRPIQVAHGHGVEAFLRKWLAEFLPKKYGVTSGYIIPNIYNDSGKIYHYDIIIYNQLDSPILWTEGNEDTSDQGKYRAIPAKHVIAVYEVKARLTKSNVTDAIDKLNQTKEFTDQLNPLYFCGVIFIDLKEVDNNKKSIIKELIKGKDVFGFTGGLVLRYEGDDTCTALINLFDSDAEEESSENKHYTPLAKPIDSLNIYLTEDGGLQIAEKGGGAKLVATSNINWDVSKLYSVNYKEGNKRIVLTWSRSHFSDFCINLLSSLEGISYNDSNRPSFGQIFDQIERKKAPLQAKTPIEGKPFIDINLYEGGEYSEKLNISFDEPDPKITFLISVKNNGTIGVVISDDSFKNKAVLQPGETAIKPVSMTAIVNGDKKNLRDIFREGLNIIYRAVYYPENSEKKFYAIERKLKITENAIEIIDN